MNNNNEFVNSPLASSKFFSSRKLLVLASIIVLLITILPGQITAALPLETSLLFFVIGMASVIGIIHELGYAAVTLNMIHWIFTLIFFFIAPLIQAYSGYSPWEFTNANNETIMNNCLIVILWIIFYICGGGLLGKRIRLAPIRYRERISKGWLRMFTFLSVICAMTIVARYGFSNLFARADMVVGEDAVEMSTMTSLVWSKCSRATIFFAEAVLIMTAIRKEFKVNKLLAMNSLVMLLVCFPAALSRNEAAAIYLGLFLILFYRDLEKFRGKPWYLFAFLASTIVLFQLINVFRRTSFGDESAVDKMFLMSQNLGDEYLSGGYDAFAIIGATVDYVKTFDMTYGRQLLGSLFFFIPRNIWTTKPIGSGAMISAAGGQYFTNISCPLVAEGYVNFGILGVILFGFFAGFLCTVIDRKYWENAPKDQTFSFIKIAYPCLLPYYFFMLRGDLMSSFAYTSAYMIVFWFLFRLSGWHIKISS